MLEENLNNFTDEKEYTSKEVAENLDISVTCLLNIKKLIGLSLLQIKKYFYWSKKDIEIVLKSKAFENTMNRKKAKGIVRKKENRFGNKDTFAPTEQHPLVKDKRFLSLLTFPTKEEITPKCFMELED